VKPLQIPIEHKTLANGLRVVVAPDSTAPVVTVGVYYKIGFRLEPQGRSGFAHLFEHMMFQGSENAPKMQHIKLVNSSGGVLNGSTMYDVTNYYEAVPSNALERVLWLEADRMRALKVDDENLRNQRDVVKEEVRVNVMNQPYGGFPWLDMPPVAFRNWANAHNFYGDFADLDAAWLADVQAFFRSYYLPNNAVFDSGDVNATEGFAPPKSSRQYQPGLRPNSPIPPNPPNRRTPRRRRRKIRTLPAMPSVTSCRRAAPGMNATACLIKLARRQLAGSSRTGSGKAVGGRSRWRRRRSVWLQRANATDHPHFSQARSFSEEQSQLRRRRPRSAGKRNY
jgi:predicted Zn-dependent peptidase